MPNGLIRPTDFSFVMRNLIQRKADKLYGEFCKLVPSDISIRAIDSPIWDLTEFEWADPVGTNENVAAFLSFRERRLETLFTARSNDQGASRQLATSALSHAKISPNRLIDARVRSTGNPGHWQRMMK